MAYLSDDDQQNLQLSAKPQDGFDLSSKTSSAMGDSGTSDQQSQSNAGSYDQSYGGNLGSSKQSTAPSGNNSTGLGSATPGGGFVNFSAFENANPDQSKQISGAGQNLVGGETHNFWNQNSKAPDTGFSTDPYGAPGWNNSTWEPPITSLTPTVGGGSAPNDPIGIGNNHHSRMGEGAPTASSAPSIGGLVSGGTPSDLKTATGWAGETYTAPQTYGWDPSKTWQTEAPELSETPVLGGVGSAKPSVVDYLAKGNIEAGNYSQGDRALDNAIISGNAKDQAAIVGNQNRFGKFVTDVGTTTDALNNRVAFDTAEAPYIQSQTAGALGDLSTGIMSAAARAAADTNNGTEAADTKALQDFTAWYNGPTGPAHGGVWTGGTTTPGQQETPDQALTPEQVQQLNNIAQIEGMAPPYPNGAPPPPSQTTISGHGSGAPPPADPGIATQLQQGPMNGGANSQIDVGTVYNSIGAGRNAINGAPGNNQWMTPQEMTLEAVLNPNDAGSYPPVTAAGLQSTLSQLEGVLQGEENQPLGGALTADAKASHIATIQKEMGAIQQALQEMSPDSPYAYGISLGMTPAQLQAMGILPPSGPTPAPFRGF